MNIENQNTWLPKVAGLNGSNPRCLRTPGGGGLFMVLLLSIRLQFCTIVIINSDNSCETLLYTKNKKKILDVIPIKYR